MFLKNTLRRIIPRRLLHELKAEVGVLVATGCNYVIPQRAVAVHHARVLRNLKVNIGCGPFNPEGWYGIDIGTNKADLQIDIRRGLPFRDSSCRFVFSEHVFEHLDMETLHNVLLECHRVLELGGAIRIITPDLARYVRAYCEKDSEFVRAVWPYEVSPAELLNGVFYVPTHNFIHDLESMSKQLHAAGFTKVYGSAYRESGFPDLNIDSDMPHRRLESLYVEAIKT